VNVVVDVSITCVVDDPGVFGTGIDGGEFTNSNSHDPDHDEARVPSEDCTDQ
jgi:hypothetical protein